MPAIVSVLSPILAQALRSLHALRPRLLVLCSLLLALAVPARADVTDAMKAIQRDGHARVILRMRSSERMAWAPRDSAGRQRAAVAAAAEDTQAALDAARVVPLRRFQTLPYVAADLTREQLMSLVTSSAVESVQLVVFERRLATAGVNQLLASETAIDTANAWALGYDGTGVAVAVIDGGFNLAQPMLASKAVAEACLGHSFPPNVSAHCPSGQTPQVGTGSASNCPAGSTRCDHGTNVAAIALGNDGTNFGVAKGAKLVAIDVGSTDTSAVDCSPDPAPCEVADSLAVLDALDYVNQHAADYNIAAVNYSYGLGSYDGYCDDDARKTAIDMLRQKGIAVAIAAGNDGVTGKTSKPGCISSAETVGATDNGASVASFSNFSTMVDFMAPGVGITAGGTTQSGTSQATPHVAGAWAVMRQAFPTATADQIETALKQTGVAVTRASAGFSVPKIQLGAAIGQLQGRNRPILNSVVSSANNLAGQSFLRFANTSSVAGNVVVALRDAATGALVANWTSPAIPAGAAPQFLLATVEGNAVPVPNAPQTFVPRNYYNLDIASSFTGYVQHVVWVQGAGVLANLSSCGTGLVSDGSFLLDVDSSFLPDYVSHIRIVNTGTFAGAATLTFLDPATAAVIAQWTSPAIASGASLDVTAPQIEALLPDLRAAAKNLAQYSVKLSGFSGYLQHAVENRIAGATVDMSAKCPLSATIAPITTSSSGTTATAATTAPR